MPKALGLVETRGLVAAIEAADAMVKTSNVTLIGKEITRPALVTIKIVGDVAAVKASVDAGAAAATKVGELVSTHVIPQPDTQMISMLPEIKDDDIKRRKVSGSLEKPDTEKPVKAEKQVEKITPPVLHEGPQTVDKEVTEVKLPETKITGVKKSPPSEDKFSGTTDHLERLRREALGIKTDKEGTKTEKKSEEPSETPSFEQLEKLNVHQLRKQARATEGFPIQGREISKANRNELLSFFKKLL